MTNSTILRANSLVDEIINKLNLDLTDTTILTDIGSNYYSFNPIIALKSNAKKIFVWCSDSNYGEAKLVVSRFIEIVNNLNLDIDRFEFALNSKPKIHINNANIITNSLHIRPIDKEFITQINSNSVIALMYEKWEVREEDIDIAYCRLKNIQVGGTWENHPNLLIFNAVGNLAQKLIYEAGLEIWQNNIFVWSDDDFGETISNSLILAGALEVFCSTNINLLKSKISILDIIFLADYDERKSYFNDFGDCIFNIHEILKLNPSIAIIHLYGDVDVEICNKYHLKVFPNFNGKAQKMSFTLGHLGLKSIINLQAAGLKVGELLFKKNYTSDLVQLF